MRRREQSGAAHRTARGIGPARHGGPLGEAWGGDGGGRADPQRRCRCLPSPAAATGARRGKKGGAELPSRRHRRCHSHCQRRAPSPTDADRCHCQQRRRRRGQGRQHSQRSAVRSNTSPSETPSVMVCANCRRSVATTAEHPARQHRRQGGGGLGEQTRPAAHKQACATRFASGCRELTVAELCSCLLGLFSAAAWFVHAMRPRRALAPRQRRSVRAGVRARTGGEALDALVDGVGVGDLEEERHLAAHQLQGRGAGGTRWT